MTSALIIDDDAMHIEVSRTLLTYAGVAQVSSASDGAAAKAIMANGEAFDLVLLDLHMPNFNGVQLLDHLRDVGSDVMIFIVTSADASLRNAAAELAVAYGLNIAGAMAKPVTLQKLTSALAHVQSDCAPTLAEARVKPMLGTT